MQALALSRRDPWVDALRVLAVLGVFIVNAMGYPFAPDYPIQVGLAQPLDSAGAQLINGLLIAFVQGKAWPLLCFLFGYSLNSIALQARAKGLVVRKIMCARYWKLLLVGVVHGALIYAGDILTSYALCGLICSRWVLLRPAKLLRIWKRFTVVCLCMALLFVVICMLLFFNSHADDAILKTGQTASTFLNAPNTHTFFLLNLGAYFANLLSALLFLPVLLWLTLAGMLAQRFNLLSSRRCARVFWSQHLLSWQLYSALILNFFFAACVVQFQRLGGSYEGKLFSISILISFIGPWLAAALLAWTMRYLHQQLLLPRWVVWLAPAAQHTLAMYLSLSVILMLSGGAYFGLAGHTAFRLFFVATAWSVAIFIARFASKQEARDPISRWLSAVPARKKYQHPAEIEN